MESPLILIFVFQIIIALIDAVGAETLNEILWSIYNAIPLVPKSSDSIQEQNLRKELFSIKKEMNNTSAQDDFAKWARLRRQFDKKNEEYNALTEKMSSTKSSFTSRISTIRFLTTNGFRLYMQWTYSKTPMYWLPKGWLPWYCEWILAFPWAPMGAVSIQVWQLACAAVIGVVADAIKSAVTVIMESRAKKVEEQIKQKTEKMK